MKLFAQIDSDNIVTQVIVVADSDAANEALGITFCKDLLGADTNWVQTSYNHADPAPKGGGSTLVPATTPNFRFRYAGIGMKYDSTNDVFYEQSPYPSWGLNTTTWAWGAPVALPDDAGYDDIDNPTEYVSYDWDEGSTSWANRTVLDLT